MKLFLRYGVGIVLGVFLFWRGIIPAFTTIETDFPNYYTSSKLFLEGADVTRFYDDAWFAGEIRSHGMSVEGRFSPFPPSTILLFIPIAWLAPQTALQVWTVINAGLLTAIGYILTRLSLAPVGTIIGLILFNGIGLANNFRFGQWYVALLLTVTAGFYFWKKGNTSLAGVCFGAGAAFKYFPVLYVLLFIFRKEWKGAAALVATIAAIHAGCALLVGTGIYERFFNSVLWNHVTADIQDPFSPSFQSWQSLLRRLFVEDPAFNPHPFIEWRSGLLIGTSAIAITVILYTFRKIRLLGTRSHETTLDLQFALLTMMGLVLLPASATYHFVMLILPVALLLPYLGEEPTIAVSLIFVLYISMGFIPYHIFTPYARGESPGLASILAYPRLALMTVMFVLTGALVSRTLRDTNSMQIIPQN